MIDGLLEQFRQLAVKVCKEAVLMVFGIIILLLLLVAYFNWLEWRGFSNKHLYIMRLLRLMNVIA